MGYRNSHTHAGYIQDVANKLNAILGPGRNYSKDGEKPAEVAVSLASLAEAMRGPLVKSQSREEKACALALLEVCALIDYGYVGSNCVWVSASPIDAEYVLAKLFGFPVEVPGLNNILGGGGFFFSRRCDSEPLDDAREQAELPGRVSLIRGEYGTGKTLLALTIASEVASKGGVAIYVTMEFSADGTLYALSRMGCDTTGKSFDIATSAESLIALANKRYRQDEGDSCNSGQRGVLAILSNRTSESLPPYYDDFFASIADLSELVLPGRSAPQLVIIDPVNALMRRLRRPLEKFSSAAITGEDSSAASRSLGTEELSPDRESQDSTGVGIRDAGNVSLDVSSPNSDAEFRRITSTALQRICERRVNLLLLAEEDSRWLGFGEDIADLVIRLRMQESQDYQMRSIAITKSRLHGEHRGWHPFRIKGGSGVQISLSTIARAAIDASRRESAETPGAFGLASLDSALSETRREAIVDYIDESERGRSRTLQIDCGHTILVKGPLGTYKTQLGLVFLSWYSDQDLRNLTDSVGRGEDTT